MAASLQNVTGILTFSGQQDKEGYTDYKVTFRVNVAAGDSPGVALYCPGLPIPGSIWSFGVDDEWTYCTWERTAKPVERADDIIKRFDVELTFTTRPMSKYCREVRFEDPILEPMKVSGGFIDYTEEATTDRFGNPITNSATERLTGPQVEFDKSRNTVRIEQNVLDLELDLLSQMNDTVNAFPLWGFPERCIKLKVRPWEKKYYGFCYAYYTRVFEFECNTKLDTDGVTVLSAFDRDLLDEGTKVLRGDWDRDPNSLTYSAWRVASGVDGTKSSDFIRFKDWNGENTKVILDGTGRPIHDNIGSGSGTGANVATSPGNVHVEKYDESDFTLLGIPTSF
jgi:hypothetical protein